MIGNKRSNISISRAFFSVFLLSILLIINVSSSSVMAKTSQDFEDKRVLFISSYSPSFPTFFLQIDGIKDTFEEYPIILDVEFMDSKRFYTEENLLNFYNLIEYKTSLIDYDLIMVSDDNGLEFVMDNRIELFSDIPIVFFGINNEQNALLYSMDSYITGVIEKISIDDTINLALDLNPNATKVIALVDDTPTGQSDLITFYNESLNFENLEFLKIDMSEINFETFLSELNTIGDDSIVILLSALRDVEGTIYEFDESVELIISNSNQPIYHLFEHGIGDGLLGGRVVSHYSQGKAAAEIVLKVFSGTDISTIELIDQSPNVYLVDFSQFNKFKLDEDKLPKSTILLNRDLSYFDEYREYIIAIIIALVLQSSIIIALIFSVRNRNKSRLEAIQSKESLLESFERLDRSQNISNVGSWELDLTTGIMWGSQEAFNIYEIERDDHGGIDLEKIREMVSEDDLKILSNALINSTEKGLPYDVFFTLHTGMKKKYIHSKASITNDLEGNPTKLLGVIKDITAIKEKENELIYISYHDALTGLHNRRYFKDMIEKFDTPEFYPLTVVMSDINGLKLINDAFGHLTGDELLISAAKVISDSCRETDIIARIGGDEFVIVMPNTNEEEAEKIIDEINENAKKVTVQSIVLSISFGFATKHDVNSDIQEIFRTAEDLMYRVKLLEIPSMRSGAIETILNTLYEKDKNSEIHSRTVSGISEKLAIAYGMNRQEVNEVKTAGLLHDIGKIIIPISIIVKQGKLSVDEYNLIKGHPEIGFRILNSTHDMRNISNIVLNHHERWDGRGYPRGIASDNIPIQSRIIAIADAFDAMTSKRTYRETFTYIDALEEILNNAGTQFDPKLVEVFKLSFDDIIAND